MVCLSRFVHIGAHSNGSINITFYDKVYKLDPIYFKIIVVWNLKHCRLSLSLHSKQLALWVKIFCSCGLSIGVNIRVVLVTTLYILDLKGSLQEVIIWSLTRTISKDSPKEKYEYTRFFFFVISFTVDGG